MSDGFDKEAEREKLREKFAEDEQKREHTQRMSELLLQGATMTNRHCDDCGDPIFRHDGQEFCPTCQATGTGDGAQGKSTQGKGARGDSQGGAQAADLEGAGNAPRKVVKTRDSDERPSQGEDRDASGSPTAGQATPPNASRNATDRNAAASNAASSPSTAEAPRDGPSATPPAEPADSGTVADARASLTRTLTRFARAAEETDNPRRARDHLQAAREAAEALAALD
ncbi:Sjogren's syndrome/scleroderma autoantigen 1 family protein [Halorubrum sp. LN27]|uniref:Sjogren's syndrome/scleroderma autoantigen 1 family protein n=1 Tax=Halorubrum sp. LN27 TaxID=2801032 RepID=UPI00190C111E|nr:Sjogren's syndrome/scleroderma autoantigen 1 family protein [Halorubrum sp. LN27]